jgi:hypothetical protein
MDTMTRVREHYEIAKAFVPEERIIGVFLYGAQNYNMDDEFSDVDTRCIYVPSFDELVFPAGITNKEEILDNDEHLTFIDIRNFMRATRMSDPSHLATLFTKYFILGPNFQELWKNFVRHRELIARYQPYAFVNIAYRISNNVAEKQKKSPYNPKHTAIIFRYESLVKDYIEGKSLEKAYIPEKADFFIKVKRGLYTRNEGLGHNQNSIDCIKEMVDKYGLTMKNIVNAKAREIIEEYQKNFIRHHILKELGENRNENKRFD